MDQEEMRSKIFPIIKDGEKVFLFLRKHWFVLVKFFAISFLMLLLPIVFYLIIETLELEPALASKIFILLTGIYLLIWAGGVITGWLDYYYDIVIVTDRRALEIEQNGVFNRRVSELTLSDVEDVSAKVKGPIQSILHFGTITVQTASEKPNFIFPNIPNAFEVSAKICSLHDRYQSDPRDEAPMYREPHEIKKERHEENEGTNFKTS